MNNGNTVQITNRKRDQSNSVRGVGQQIAGIFSPSLSSNPRIESYRDEIHNVPYEMQPKNKSAVIGMTGTAV